MIDSYQEVLRKYGELLKENTELKRENEWLKSQLGIIQNGKDKGNTTTIADNHFNKYSSTVQKIELFRSLFRGREDVFARRWYSKTSEKSGYQPVCENEWVENVCDKRKYKCSICPNRKLLLLTDADLYKHLEGKDNLGRDVIGIYPMLLDETCFFLCADFDNESYEEDVTAFREICEKYEIPVSIERSRSGNGAHAWIFFESPILASIARKLGSGILTKAMEIWSELSFQSYDRLFPNQDTMPNGGFGNLVALPLQGQSRKNNNSVFIDKYFEPYNDQWSYLANIQKLKNDKVEMLVTILCEAGELGTLVSDSDGKPWDSKTKTPLSSTDFPPILQIVRSNMLYIPREALSPNAQNQIKRLAAFRNPDFYKAQAMRLPIYDKPRIICTAELSNDYIGVPRGCENELNDLLDNASVSYVIEDKTNIGSPIAVTFNGELREEQQPAANALLEHPIGVLSATTAFGKTVIASHIIGCRKTNTLVLVHTQALMEQWKKSLLQFLIFDIIPPEPKKSRGRKKPWSPVGLLGAGKDTLHGIVDIAIMQSLISNNEVKELVRNYGLIIVDECHHVSAVNFEVILKYANAKYVYGLTATHTRHDGHHPIIIMQCGPIRYRVDAKTQAQNQPFEHYLIPRFTSHRSITTEKNIAMIYRELSESEARNNLIIKDVINAIQNGRSPIILTERRKHVALLAEQLIGHCDNIIQLIGNSSAKERRESLERLEQIPPSESLVIVATGKYVGEGFDYPRLDTLFLALPIAWKGKVVQYAGRLNRNYPSKTEVQVYDYVDIHLPVLERMYQKRVKSYAAIGYKTKFSPVFDVLPDLIYDGKNFYPVFCKDIENTKKEIFIVSPYIRKNRLTQMIKTISPVRVNGVSVTVITRPPENFKEKDRGLVVSCIEYLKQYGINVVLKSNFHQKFTIIDQSIVWYGSVNFLSFGNHEESIMRFENGDIAVQLMDTVI